MISRKFANETGSSKNRIEYIFGKGHEHKCEKVELVGGNVISNDIKYLIAEMDTPCHLRQAATGKDSANCHMHYMLSLPPGEHLSRPEWRRVLEKTMSTLGYTEDHKFFGMLHHDTRNQHMHILANRISMRDYKLVSESNDYNSLMNICREIEQEYGLHVVPMPHETFGVNLTREEVEASQKTGQVAWKHKLIARVATALERTQEKGGNVLDFIKLLNKAAIGVELKTDKAGKPTGISYKFEGKTISGRDLKRSRFTWQNLIKNERLHYDESMLFELQRIVSTRNGAAKETTESKPTRLPGISLIVPAPSATKKTSRVNIFAVVVHADRFRRTAVSRLLTPSYERDNLLYYLFHTNEKLSRNEIQMRDMAKIAAKMAITAIKLLEALFSIFRCRVEVDYNPICLDGKLYSLTNPQMNTKTNSYTPNT